MASGEQKLFLALTTLLKQESNYGAYRAAVERDATIGCIPWHGTHLGMLCEGIG